MPKVSVIIPVYNVEQYLSKCLESVINQTLQDIEIICINDGSTDNSLQILEEYAQKDSRIIVINQQNQGVAAARNKGLEIASGCYIGFVDPDDWVDSDFFEKLYEKSENETIDILKGNFDIVHTDGTTETTKEQEQIEKELQQTNFPFNSFYSAWLSAIYKKDLIDNYKINFPDTLYLEDIAFLHKFLYVASSFGLVNNTFYHNFKRPDSLTTKKQDKKMYEHCFNSRKDIAIFLNENEINKDRYLQFFNNKVIGGCYYSLLCLVQNLGFENFDYFSEFIFNVFDSCKYKDDLLNCRNDEFIKILKNKNTKKLRKLLVKQHPELSFLQKIFSIKNWGCFKILSILGFEIAIPLIAYRKLLKLEETGSEH